MKYRLADGSFANYFFVTNPHGDVVALADGDGNVVNRYAYGPWGEATRVSEQIHQPFRYAGYYFDDVSGLYWLGSRHYEPATGRFLSKDTADPDIRDVKSLNAYAYADDAPATHIDPAGTSPVKPRSSGPWKPKVGPPKPKPQPFKPDQMGGGGGGGPGRGDHIASGGSCVAGGLDVAKQSIMALFSYGVGKLPSPANKAGKAGLALTKKNVAVVTASLAAIALTIAFPALGMPLFLAMTAVAIGATIAGNLAGCSSAAAGSSGVPGVSQDLQQVANEINSM